MSGFSWPARVYWEDTDGGGIVYYANYLRFLERARTEWLRQQGYSQQRLAREEGILFTVVSLEIEYRAPARLDDELEVSCEPRPQGQASLRFAQASIGAPRERSASCSPRRTCVWRASMRARCVRGACRRSCWRCGAWRFLRA